MVGLFTYVWCVLLVFAVDLLDSNPLLIEGILAIPEETYQTLTIPPNVRVVDTVGKLGCKGLEQVGGKP